MKIFVASFNRASDGAISLLKKKMADENMLVPHHKQADYILAVGDRKETFDFVLERYRENMKIIHLWAGESSKYELHDDVYRHAMTLMSCLQLCTNDEAKMRVKRLCRAAGKIYNVATVGNVMLDNMEIDESEVPNYEYDLILYNPTTRLSKEGVYKEIEQIYELKKPRNYIWIEPNGDKYSELVKPHITHKTLPRPKFLGILKNCHRFYTNSSCQYYEAPFLLKPEQIIPIGERNTDRESKYADMTIPNASDNIMKVFRSLR